MSNFICAVTHWSPKSIRVALCCLVTASCLEPLANIARAATGPSAANGQKLSQQYCAECHVVLPSGKRGWTDAPGFVAIANHKDTTARTLRDFIEQNHMHMKNTGRPPAEASDIAAYIMTLRTP